MVSCKVLSSGKEPYGNSVPRATAEKAFCLKKLKKFKEVKKNCYYSFSHH